MIINKFFDNSSNKQFKSNFDEGPRQPIVKTTVVNSSSIDTSLIDGWRQGVELSDIKYFDAGIVKIHAGEPGHQLRQTMFGYGKSVINKDQVSWNETDNFNPVTYINAASIISSSITWPLSINDDDFSSSDNFDGVIEPLAIRRIADFSGIDNEFYSVKAAIMDGNITLHNASDRILSIDYFHNTSSLIAFNDIIDKFDTVALNGEFNYQQSTINAFDDKQLSRDIPFTTNFSSDFISALSAVYVSGSENITYKTCDVLIRYNQISATSGFIFDSVQGIGTDSIAFGGLQF